MLGCMVISALVACCRFATLGLVVPEPLPEPDPACRTVQVSLS